MPGRLNGSQAYTECSITNSIAAEITDRTTEKYFTTIVKKITELYDFTVEVHSENGTC